MSFGAAPPGMDEYQRLMAERNAAAKRKRLIFGVVALAAVGGGYFFWSKEAGKKKQAQAILDAGGKLAMADKADMGQFWSCVFGTDTDVGMFQSGDQIQQRIESAYFTQKATYSEHLTTDCVPKLEGARSSISGIEKDMLPALKPPYDKYVASLPKMQAGIESYAEKLKSRGSVKDVDQSIQEVGAAFSTDVTPESVAFEKFLVCAIPGIDKMKDVQAVLEFIAKDCKKDPVPFMTRVRTECGALVTKVDKDAKPSPSKSFKANSKKFFEEDQRQLRAWSDCGRWSRKGKKQLDLEEFMMGANDYIEARGEFVRTAKEEAARISGEPLPAEKKSGAAPGAPAAE